MLQKLAEQIEEVRRQIDEPVSKKVSNNYITRLLFEGHVRTVGELYSPTDDITVMSSVNAQQGYSLPSNYVAVTDVIFQWDIAHQQLTKWDRKTMFEEMPQSASQPTNYAIDEARKLLLLYPTPSSSAITVLASGSTAVTDLTVTVGSSTGFAGNGWIIIDNEIIQYTGLTSTQFTGCVRGACNTTASTHASNAVITMGDIYFAYTRLPTLNTHLLPTNGVWFTNASPTVTASLNNWLSGQNIYAGDYIGLGQMSTITNNENFPLSWYQIKSIPSSNTIVLTTNYNEPTAAGVNAVITSASELFEQDCTMPILWAKYRIEGGPFGNPEKAKEAIGSYDSALLSARKRRNGPDKLNVIHNNKFSGIGSSLVAPKPAGNFEAWPMI
jgi:hypothetical protein